MDSNEKLNDISMEQSVCIENTDDYSTNTNDTQIPNKDFDNNENISENINSRIKKDVASKFATQNEGDISTQYIINIDHVNGNILSVEDEKISVKSKESVKQYKLYERSECSEFVKEYKKSLHLACAISISFFEYVPVAYLQILSERLLKHFPETLDKNGNEDNSNTNPFLSLDDILSAIGAQICMVAYASKFENLTVRCVHFAEQPDKVMENFWELFPMLRNEIISWLIEIYFLPQNNSFNAVRSICAIEKIIKFDFSDSISRLFEYLKSDKKNKHLLIGLFIILVKDETTRYNSCKILEEWSVSQNWLWEIPLTVFAETSQDFSFIQKLRQTLYIKIRNSLDNNTDIQLICKEMLISPKLRTIIASVFDELFAEATTPHRKESVSLIYILTILKSYSFVNKKKITLPLVTFDSKQQAQKIKPIILNIISDFSLRQGLFIILEAYMDEIKNYDITLSLLNSLKSFFYILAKNNQRHYGDILRFLVQLQSKNKIAKDIMIFLQEKITHEKEILLI